MKPKQQPPRRKSTTCQSQPKVEYAFTQNVAPRFVEVKKSERLYSIWTFILPSMLIAGTVAGYMSYAARVNAMCEDYSFLSGAAWIHQRDRMDVASYRIAKALKNSPSLISQISYDLENGHIARADRELHQLKLELQGGSK